MKPIKPTKLAPEAYNRQLFENIKRREGVVPRVYSDPKGIPTIGIGHALAGWNETQEKHVLPEKPKLDEQFQDALGKPDFNLSDAGYGRLRQAVDMVNKGDTKGAMALIPTYERNTETPDKNKFGFTLPDAGSRHFFQEDRKTHEGQVLDGIGRAAREAGWDPDKTKNFQDALRNSREMQELVSLSYNGVPPNSMPKATKHILNGDRAGAYFEIAYRTNSADQPDSMRPGIANRRVGEARALLGDPATWPPEQRKELDRILKENGGEIAAYEKRFPGAFKDGGRFGNILNLFFSYVQLETKSIVGKNWANTDRRCSLATSLVAEVLVSAGLFFSAVSRASSRLAGNISSGGIGSNISEISGA